MVSNVYPDHRYFFLESGNSDNDLQLGANSSSVRGKQISNFYNRRETFRDKYKNCFLDMRVKLNCLESLYICRTHWDFKRGNQPKISLQIPKYAQNLAKSVIDIIQVSNP